MVMMRPVHDDDRRAPPAAPPAAVRTPERIVVRAVTGVTDRVLALGPQVHLVGVHMCISIIKITDLVLLGAGKLADHGQVAAPGVNRGIIEALAAGDEA